MIIDTHAHLMFDDFQSDLEEVVKRAEEAGVEKIINIACDPQSWERGLDLLKRYPQFYLTLGYHPYESDQLSEEVLERWRELIAENERIVAVGECGLDYFKCKIEKSVQKAAFRRQLIFAEEVGLPVVIHNREADDDCLAVLEEFVEDGQLRVEVVFHCYGSDLVFARRVWALGAYTSFTGIVTYPNAGVLQEVVKAAPLEQFMVETDCPYLAPQSQRGKRNESSYLPEVVEKIADLKGLSSEKVSKITTENAKAFFSRLA